MKLIHQLLDNPVQNRPHHRAVEDDCGAITYQALVVLSDQLRDRLHHLGVQPGDRVGIYLHKSIDAVAAIFGILKTGAAYVPVDPGAPVSRNAYILGDCSVRAVIVEEPFVEALQQELAAHAGEVPTFMVLERTGGGEPLRRVLDRLQESDPAPLTKTVNGSIDGLAYILYTSGSTGKPKGVMLSHRNAVSYVDWCSDIFQPGHTNRFSSHAPFHFDLSILDLYVPLKHGATLVLIDAETGKDPVRLATLIAEKGITNWYSTPSILSLLAQYGKMETQDYAALKMVLFAGEVFPVKHLRALKQLLPQARCFNLYGPTETNVCTFYEIPAVIPEERTQPYPIGQVCSHFEAVVVDEQGQVLPEGQEGELCVRGEGTMQGYWNLPERTERVFFTSASGKRWYRTGDIVVQEEDGNYLYVGRRDRMIKKRGYRIELGEIEAGLYRHPAVEEAAVIALADDEYGVRVKAFLSCRQETKRPSLIELKRFCAEHLPIYMVPDLFAIEETLPKTSTDKIDYQKLKELSV